MEAIFLNYFSALPISFGSCGFNTSFILCDLSLPHCSACRYFPLDCGSFSISGTTRWASEDLLWRIPIISEISVILINHSPCCSVGLHSNR